MNEKNPKVYVSQETQHDLSPAEKYGDLVFLHYHEFRPYSGNGSLRNEEMLRNSSVTMREYDPVNDFILPVGNPILIGWTVHTALTVAKAAGCREVKYLYWDKMESQYRVAKVPVVN